MVRSASPGSMPGAPCPEPAQADHLAVGHALGNHHVHVAAGRRAAGASWPRCATSSRVTVRVAATSSPFCRAAARLWRVPSPPAERKASPKSWEKMSSPRSAPKPRCAARRRGRPPKPEAGIRKVLGPGAAASAAEALEALEARLALGIDLAAVELRALVRVAEDLVGRVRLRELVLGLGVVRVAVRVIGLGELAERLLDLRFARGLRDTPRTS